MVTPNKSVKHIDFTIHQHVKDIQESSKFLML
jgi:hypothetical protein